ncbi:MAG: S46 family peptidase, partial [Melioribacteraceae bacterium]|nr:S46 family peptidase [Melioribacteraceae bacterium]
AFVSSDGLIMTNHHCGRGQLKNIQEEDENLLRDGFYAETLDEERTVPNLFVDQLISIKDVTIEVKEAFNKGETYDEKVSNRNSKIDQLAADYEEDTDLIYKVVKLYNGNKYSLYAYKRYSDIRLVMAPDFQIAATGWDWDNFTYPRYELDFMFYRAYDEDGNPVESEHHFTWSEKGASEDEPVFVVGRPGHTDRQLSVAQLEYLRDVTYPQRLLQYNELYKIYFKLFEKYPERESELLNKVMGVGNGRKSYAGRLLGLRNPYLMKKKVDFENILIGKVEADKSLNENYGQIWDGINEAVTVLRRTANEYYGYSLQRRGNSAYFTVAQKLIDYAEEMKKPEDERLEKYQGEQL